MSDNVLPDDDNSAENQARRMAPPLLAMGFLQPEVLERINLACELALKNQLNKNESDPQLKALADKWKNMDAFSKRELGEKDQIKTGDMPRALPPNAVQITPGQKAEVTGPATIYGGQVELENDKPTTKT